MSLYSAMLMNRSNVHFECVGTIKCPGAQAALVRSLSGVGANVNHQVPVPGKSLGTQMALEGTLTRVATHMLHYLGLRSIRHGAQVARIVPYLQLPPWYDPESILLLEHAVSGAQFAPVDTSTLLSWEVAGALTATSGFSLSSWTLVPCIEGSQ